MPFAVSCRSCGARFSVADELYQKRFAGRIVTVRCKHCQASIRLDASEPPRKPRLPQPPPRPLGAAKQRPEAPRRPAPPRRLLALSRGLLHSQPGGGGSEGVFDAPPPSEREQLAEPPSAPPIDLTLEARSEPPSSRTPPLGDLAMGTQKRREHASEDLDFLLGLSGSPGTAAALASPSLPTFDEPSKSNRTASQESTADLSLARTGSHPTRARSGLLVFALLGLAAIGVALWFARTRGRAALEPEPALNASSSNLVRLNGNASAAEPRRPAGQANTLPSDPTEEPAPPKAPEPDKTSPRQASAKSRTRPASSPEPTTPRPNFSATVATSAPPPVTQPDKTEFAPFDRSQASAALASATAEAGACRQEGDPSGTASVTVTFAPSGRVTSAVISGPPFAGTKTGGCIARALRRATIPAFSGEKVTVAKTVVIH